jgi:protein transport protein SEC61 subunit gamma-like protein
MRILEKLSPAALKEKLLQYRRTIEIARKPDREEWISSAKVSGLGILVIGGVGFVVFIAYYLILNALRGGLA